MDLEVDVDGVERTLKRIERDIHRGMEKSSDSLADNAKSHARKVISEENAIFNAEVYKGFKTAETKNTPTSVRIKLYNNIVHAEALEDGAEFGNEGPPVEALLPWVQRKMATSSSNDRNWGESYTPEHFRNDDDDDDGDDSGGFYDDESVQRPGVYDSDNWTGLPKDYEDGQDVLDKNTIIKGFLGSGTYSHSHDGHVFGWNGAEYRLRPASTGLEYYKKDKNDEWEFVDTVDDITYFKPDDPESVLGYQVISDTNANYELYRSRELPNSVSQDFDHTKWNDVSDWEGHVGMEVVYRGKKGLVHEGEVLRVEDDHVTFSTYDNSPDTDGIWIPDLNQNEVIAVEDFDDEDKIPLFDVEKEDLSIGESVYVAPSNSDIPRKVVELKENTFMGQDGTGLNHEYDYDEIVSSIQNGPVSGRLDYFEKGDRVSLYDADADEVLELIITGEGSKHDHYKAIDEHTGDKIGEVPQSRFIDWESAPTFQKNKITSEMREFEMTSSQDGKDEFAYVGQEVALYNPIEGQTRIGNIQTSPYQDSFKVYIPGDGSYDIDNSDWDVRGGVDFEVLTDSDQKQIVKKHFKQVVDVDGGDQKDKDWFKDQLVESIYANYSDDFKLADTVFSWTELNINNNRAHAGEADANDGWELQMPGDPSKSTTKYDTQEWQRTFGHEFGHAYSQPTVASQVMFGYDPDEYKFAQAWTQKGKQSHSHMYDESLPDWEFGASDPFHGFAENYMFTEDDAKDYVNYDSNNELDLDTRDQMDPYGFSEWGDHVQELAIADAQGLDLSKKKMDVKVKQVTDQQVFGGDDYSIEEGDYVSIEVDGDVVTHTVDKITAQRPNFNENPDDSEIPRTGNLITFSDLDGSQTDLYIGDDGIAYGTDSDRYGSWLTTENEEFIGTATVSNYDPSLDEFPDLDETDDTKRLQEAANMAWWYQANFIEHDSSTFKRKSSDRVLNRGYSSTNAEEVMSSFTEALAHPDPNSGDLEDLEIAIEEYPFFVEELLKQRQPVHTDVKQLLEKEGFLP